MATITINELIIERKPLKETGTSKVGNEYTVIKFFGSETEKYKDVEKKSYFSFSIMPSQYNEEIQKKIMSLSVGDKINVVGKQVGGREISVSSKGLTLNGFYASITPTNIQVISKVNTTAPKEEIVQDDEIPF